MKKNQFHLILPVVFLFLTVVFIIGCKKDTSTLAIIETKAPGYITQTTGQSGGVILSDGQSDITARGVCWKVNQDPTISDSKTVDGSGSGSFSSQITGLSPNTLYYIRAYATNSKGTAYGETMLLKTAYGTMTDFDGNVYHTVMIGTQEWMAENLKVTHYSNGDPIPYVTDNDQWIVLSTGAYSWYENDYESYGQYYGALYNWFALTDSRRLCPAGWHLPSLSEWQTMFTYLGGNYFAGGKLKSTRTNLSQHPYWTGANIGATNETGFSAFPGGFRSYFGGGYSGLEASGYWWTSDFLGDNLQSINLSCNGPEIIYELHNPKSGVSVRCVRD